MSQTLVSMTDLRRELAKVVERVADGKERIILVSHGRPKVAIVSMEDLQWLEQLVPELHNKPSRYTDVLVAADRLREQIRGWQEAHGLKPEDTVETLRQVRATRDHELAGLC